MNLFLCLLQDLATADKVKKQAQTERDELQEEITSTNAKKYEPTDYIQSLYSCETWEKQVNLLIVTVLF